MKLTDILTGRVWVTVITVGFIVYFIYAMVGTGSAIKKSEGLLEEYKTALAEQEIVSEGIDYDEQIEGSDEHIEQVARQRLGLCKTNEKIFVTEAE